MHQDLQDCGANHREPIHVMFAFTPRNQQQADRIPPLIEETLPLPPLMQLRSRDFLEQLYIGRHLSVYEIAALTDVSHSVVLAAMDRLAIPKNGNGHKRRGQLPFGFDYINCCLVKNRTEQEVIRMICQFHVSGLSLWKIAGELNRRLIRTKNSGIWQANTVRKILARA